MPNVDPAAVVGIDGNGRVPGLVEGADLTNYGLPNQPQAQTSTNNDMDIDGASVNMVVVDGIVMGPTVCKYTYTYCIYKTELYFSIVHIAIAPLN